MRIVFDSSIWVSALQFGGVPRAAIEWSDAHDEIVFCKQIEDEVVKTLAEKFSSPAEMTRLRVAVLGQNARWVLVRGSISGICRDPKDDFVLECGVLGKADAIVTGDKDLLSLKMYEGIRILTPRQYLDDLL